MIFTGGLSPARFLSLALLNHLSALLLIKKRIKKLKNKESIMPEIELTDQNFEQEVLKETKMPVLVDFWAPWCGPCKMQGSILEEMAKEMEGKAKIAKLNVDEGASSAQRYQVRAIPSLMIFKNGEKVWQAVGLHNKEKLVEALAKYV
jgi:thioredoxin 1